MHRTDETSRSQFTTVQGAMFGLLALLLAFTFAMAAGRFDARKQLVLEEANAIGTAYLRGAFLPPESAAHARSLLQRYVTARLGFFEAGRDRDRLTAAIADSEQLQGELWPLAVQAANADSRNVAIGLFAESINEIIDAHEKRLTAMNGRVPESILLLLFIVAVMTMMGVGYGFGLGGKQIRFPTYMSIILITAVMVIILDLDRPRRGLIEVGQGSLLRLEREFSENVRQ